MQFARIVVVVVLWGWEGEGEALVGVVGGVEVYIIHTDEDVRHSCTDIARLDRSVLRIWFCSFGFAMQI